jgi:transcriptional antiterminator RfaH
MSDAFVPETDHWFVLCTRSRYEKKLSELLNIAGIENFLPIKIERKKWSDRWKNVEVPLFPGYLFVQMEESNRFTILNTPGSVRFLYHCGEYAQLSRRDVDMINIAMNNKQELEIVENEFADGQIVKINSGPFKGFEAKLVHHNGKGKLLLEVQAIAQGVLVEIENAEIVPNKNKIKA